MNNIAQLIEQLIAYSKSKLNMKADDENYIRNQLLAMLNVSEPCEKTDKFGRLQEDILDPILDYAIENKLTTAFEKIIFETKLMGLVTPMPSAVREQFDFIAHKEGVIAATTWFNKLNVACNYIRMVDINKNIYWPYNGPMGEIGITINLSKPEKDPKEIAAALKVKKAAYPACLLCPTNVGFNGNLSHPSRVTLRTIPIILNKEFWHFQYSPYMYFDEHCIALSDEHRPMKVTHDTYTRLFDFVEIFPNYFLGSNAALPIVGGSILAHDHYQGGLKVLPVMKCGNRYEFISKDFPNVKISIVNWYNSVIRLSSNNREELQRCVNFVHDSWENYSDETVGIFAKTTEQHNAITPIARIEDKEYAIELILRNNRTDEKHPFGIYHPTEDLHNIKKEGIGLIEAMGRFILPGRLVNEANEIKEYLTGKKKIDFKELSKPENPLSKHIGMIAQLVNDNGTHLTDEVAGDVVTDYINRACVRILECTAVFKNDEQGQNAFIKFANSMNFFDRITGRQTIVEKKEEPTLPKTRSKYVSDKEKQPIKSTEAKKQEKVKEAEAQKETAQPEPEKKKRGRPKKD